MGAGPVPVAADRLGVEGDRDPEVLAEAVQQPAGDPQLVGHLERAERADLELPLARHDLGVDARDGQAGGQAGVEVGLDEGPPVDVVGADAAVVRALRAGVARLLREAERPAALEEGVLLLDPEQRLLPGVLLATSTSVAPGCWSGAGSSR